MIISQAQVRLAAEHRLESRSRREESLRMWVGPLPANLNRPTNSPTVSMERVSLSAEAFSASRLAVEGRARQAVQAARETQGAGEPALPRKLGMLKLLLEKMTGVKFQVSAVSLRQNANSAPVFVADDKRPEEPPDPGFGMIYRFHETSIEAEDTTFSAEGRLTTADGRTIDFRADFAMERFSSTTTEVEIREGNAKLADPLVLTLEGAPGRLADATFRLDLDGNGTVDDVRWAGRGSAFLAWDRDGDGTVGDASELFGPRSGDGFGELGALDADNSGWIDEADPAFYRLSLWALGDDGEGALTPLTQAGVGAIGLGSVATPFSVKDSQAALAGQVRSSGVFITESGGVGAVQHIDLVV